MKFQGFGILELQRKLISSIIFWNVFKSHFRKLSGINQLEKTGWMGSLESRIIWQRLGPN